MKRLFRIEKPTAVFGVWVEEDGSLVPNLEIGETCTYPDIEALRGHAERLGGTVTDVTNLIGRVS